MKAKKNIPAILLGLGLLLIIFSSRTAAQSKVFIAPMESNFSDYLKTAFMKYKVPVILTVDDTKTDYIVTGGPVKSQNKWYDSGVAAVDQQNNRKPIVIYRLSDRALVWSSANGRNRDIFWDGILSAVPEQSLNLWILMQSIDEGKKGRIANHLALDMKRDVFKKK